MNNLDGNATVALINWHRALGHQIIKVILPGTAGGGSVV